MSSHDLIRAALYEDLPSGDLTTDSLAMPPRPGRARLLVKQDLVLSGSSLFEQAVTMLEPQCQLKWHFHDGQRVLDKQVICTLQGDLIQILKAERVGLNFLMHLSGIATHTRRFVEAIAGTNTQILDTRKTLPGYRDLEKKAVVHGGGRNHRADLSSMVLIKDNHIRLMGGIRVAVERIRKRVSSPLIVEAESLADVEECVQLQVGRILLDNMDNAMLAQALKLIPTGIETEASGNMTLERVGQVARLGVQFISVGALTHSAPSSDLSLEFDWSDTVNPVR